MSAMYLQLLRDGVARKVRLRRRRTARGAAIGVDVLGAQQQKKRRPSVDDSADPHRLAQRHREVQPAPLVRALLPQGRLRCRSSDTGRTRDERELVLFDVSFSTATTIIIMASDVVVLPMLGDDVFRDGSRCRHHRRSWWG